MIGLNLWQKPQQVRAVAALYASQIMRAKAFCPVAAANTRWWRRISAPVALQQRFAICFALLMIWRRGQKTLAMGSLLSWAGWPCAKTGKIVAVALNESLQYQRRG